MHCILVTNLIMALRNTLIIHLLAWVLKAPVLVALLLELHSFGTIGTLVNFTTAHKARNHISNHTGGINFYCGYIFHS